MNLLFVVICTSLQVHPNYENTDQVLRLGGNWPIVGAGQQLCNDAWCCWATYAIDGNIVIDTYENVWAWDKGTTPYIV